MKICVVGLGLIGGSLCLSLRRAGYEVYGFNRSPEPLQYALSNNIINGAAGDFNLYDAVFVALPPRAAARFICGTAFKDGAVVADICGVKGFIESEVNKQPRNFFYVGTHPMAGKEVSGIRNAVATLFDNASMVITSNPSTNAGALSLIKSLTKDIGFKYIVECSAEVHDRKIAYTSQLAHVVSNAYVKNDEISCCLGFTGGSFQDMTRIAGVDDGVWSELYLLNAKNLSNDIAVLVDRLLEVKSAVDKGDGEALRAVLRQGREGSLEISAQRRGSGKFIRDNGAEGKGIKLTRLK